MRRIKFRATTYYPYVSTGFFTVLKIQVRLGSGSWGPIMLGVSKWDVLDKYDRRMGVAFAWRNVTKQDPLSRFTAKTNSIIEKTLVKMLCTSGDPNKVTNRSERCEFTLYSS